MILYWNFLRGREVLEKNPTRGGGMDIFGSTHFILIFQEQIILNLTDVKYLWINKYNKYDVIGGWFWSVVASCPVLLNLN